MRADNPADPDIATIAAALGDRARSRMVSALMDGRARTAGELALDGGVTASTASAHLARLLRLGLVAMVRQGRHRYFSIVDPDVAAGIEGLMRMASQGDAPAPRFGPRDPELREARVCFDHLAGALGVALNACMIAAGHVVVAGETATLSPGGERWLQRIGIDVDTLRAQRRATCRMCMDWSERRMHLAGGLGAELLRRTLEVGLFKRIDGSRAVWITPRARRFVQTLELA